MTQPSAPSRATAAFGAQGLLLDLINNPADPGYAAVAARRMKRDEPRQQVKDKVLTAVGAALIGVLLVVAYLHTHRIAPATSRTHDALVSKVRSAQQDARALQQQIETLQSQISDVRDRILPRAGQLLNELQLMRIEAGTLAVFGSGVLVTLGAQTKSGVTPAPRAGSTSIATTSTLTDRDVRSVVNELWHDGAEAISVNDIRLTPTSAIRFAGQAVLVDFQPVTSPYRIRAIGDPDVLVTNFASSAVVSRYHTLAGLGDVQFSFAEQPRVDIKAGTVAAVHYAQAAS